MSIDDQDDRLTLSNVANSARSVLERYFCWANRRSSSITWAWEKAARDLRFVFLRGIPTGFEPMAADAVVVKFLILSRNDFATSLVALLKRCWRYASILLCIAANVLLSLELSDDTS